MHLNIESQLFNGFFIVQIQRTLKNRKTHNGAKVFCRTSKIGIEKGRKLPDRQLWQER